jgi:capsule polysaccharide export protein KpsC/LpsZ
LWANFSRRWQGLPNQGGQQVRAQLGLDDVSQEARPVVLLAANVIGDSLTLGRQVFTDSMTEWLQRTVQQFSTRPDLQLILRIHPGERYTQGPSVADVVRQTLPDLPSHIHLVAADDPVNTYDLIEIADLGLVYTTTVGMEMAMSAVPAVVVGHTHYRGKGFTLDPHTWEEYSQILEQVLTAPAKYRLSRLQVEQAWNYAYRFFFEYPNPFPWHLLHFWNELETWPVERVLADEGQAYTNTFRYLTGEPVDWSLSKAVI